MPVAGLLTGGGISLVAGLGLVSFGATQKDIVQGTATSGNNDNSGSSTSEATTDPSSGATSSTTTTTKAPTTQSNVTAGAGSTTTTTKAPTTVATTKAPTTTVAATTAPTTVATTKAPTTVATTKAPTTVATTKAPTTTAKPASTCYLQANYNVFSGFSLQSKDVYFCEGAYYRFRDATSDAEGKAMYLSIQTPHGTIGEVTEGSLTSATDQELWSFVPTSTTSKNSNVFFLRNKYTYDTFTVTVVHRQSGFSDPLANSSHKPAEIRMSFAAAPSLAKLTPSNGISTLGSFVMYDYDSTATNTQIGHATDGWNMIEGIPSTDSAMVTKAWFVEYVSGPSRAFGDGSTAIKKELSSTGVGSVSIGAVLLLIAIILFALAIRKSHVSGPTNNKIGQNKMNPTQINQIKQASKTVANSKPHTNIAVHTKNALHVS